MDDLTNVIRMLNSSVDNSGNVSNMDSYREAIEKLERMEISKTMLEETRIGKLLNNTRKRLDVPELSRRIRKLLRKWQAIVMEIMEKEHEPSTPNSNQLPPPLSDQQNQFNDATFNDEYSQTSFSNSVTMSGYFGINTIEKTDQLSVASSFGLENLHIDLDNLKEQIRLDEERMSPFESIIDPMETLKKIIQSNHLKIEQNGDSASAPKSNGPLKQLNENLDRFFVPDTEAIGLNGCLSEDGTYYSFTKPMPCVSTQLVISPYIAEN